MRLATGLAAAVAVIVMLARIGSAAPVLPDTVVGRALLFYAITAIAYVVLPFVRRTDIAVVAMWLVLAAGVAPCFGGEELSASHTFAGMAGVLLAAAPIFIARFRQIAQGDIGALRRRETEL
jgi:hypothetical protein